MAQFVQPQPYGARRSVVRLAMALALAAAMLVGVGRLQDMLPSFSNPFASETVDRSAPAVLHALRDVSEYRAASAEYSVIVDMEKDTRYVPSFLKGERTVFVAVGSVDASVDFGALDESAVSLDGESVTLRLPEAKLGEATIDPAQSRVVSRERGALDRIGSVFSDSPTSERSLYLAATRKFDSAAKSDAALTRRAEQNTQAMLQRLLTPLGFEDVTVTFGPARPA
ncbi:MAG: DUF4230 domain-containing protein [Actinobacteria bacterium]|nr:DUF4230 domain-containing protein [Actinomycetota bacterium]